MKRTAFYLLAPLCCLLVFQTVHAQYQTDQSTEVINDKSETPYAPFEGKVIRKITLKQLGFGVAITDSSQMIKYYGAKLLNALHTDTRDWVIRDNLFIKEGSRLNQFLVADNERHLRTLEFIQDARIVAKPVRGNNDAVDLEVVTKDLFSITGSFDIGSRGRQRFRIADNNLAGAGQKVQLITLIDQRRDPNFGYDLSYTKNSVAHTFINASIGYSKINRYQQSDEGISTFYIQLDRPLISPYSRIAGGFLVSFNKASNAFQKPRNLYYDFQNAIVDVWAGYNIGVNRLVSDNQYRKRTFVAVRHLEQNFSRVPFQIGSNFSPYYNSKRALLSELTLFRQEFIKTNYLYGFGTTEDVPYGYNIALTSGWTKQSHLSRAYFGITANRFIVTPKNEFLQGFVRVGAYPNQGRAEDVGLLAGMSFYSKLNEINNTKLRHYLRFSYTRIVNKRTIEPLRLNNPLGLQFFNADSLTGTRRISSYGETFMFPKYKPFGFNLAPFAFAETSPFTPENRGVFSSGLYTGFGGGLRTRNENLALGTIEVRLIYFPKTVQNLNHFNVTFRSNIRFRYNRSYVRAPNTVQLNTNENDSFF